MERWGVKIDSDLLEAMSNEFKEKIYDLEQSIFQQSGEKFNINSPKQLGFVLFEKMGLPAQKKTKKKTGFSTDMEVMASLAKSYPIAADILSYRTYSKLKNTYIDSLPKLVNPETGRVHTSYNQTVAATGRLSSSDPNLQNIPIRGDEGERSVVLLFLKPAGILLPRITAKLSLEYLLTILRTPRLFRLSYIMKMSTQERRVKCLALLPDWLTTNCVAALK